MIESFRLFFIFFSLSLFLSGCFSFRTSNQVPRQQNKLISRLKEDVTLLNQELYNIELKKEKELSELRKLEKKLKQKLEKEIRENEASVNMNRHGLSIRFLSKVFFAKGATHVSENGKKSLDKISSALSDFDHELRIEGHTDNDPIKRTKNRYHSNWELSAARSLKVLTYLIAKGEISPKLFSIVAYGEYRPISSNATAQGRTKNSRVEIVVVPNYYDKHFGIHS